MLREEELKLQIHIKHVCSILCFCGHNKPHDIHLIIFKFGLVILFKLRVKFIENQSFKFNCMPIYYELAYDFLWHPCTCFFNLA